MASEAELIEMGRRGQGDLATRAMNPHDFIHGELKTGVLYGRLDFAARDLRIAWLRAGLISAPVDQTQRVTA